MKYKIRKYSNLKRRNIFDTYEPGPRKISKQESVHLFLRVGQKLAFVGGLIGIWAASILMGLSGSLGFKRKLRRFEPNKKVVEIRVKK